MAAVWTGRVAPATGGDIKVEILAKMTEFPAGEKQHGVPSRRWGNAAGTHAFKFVD